MDKRHYSAAILMAFLFFPALLSAQYYSGDLEYRKWRVTLINPLSTNGINALDYTAKYSINIIGGYHGGLNGTEIAGIFNAEKHYASGFQLAGVLNYSGGYTEGVNIAGVLNYSNKNTSGIQIAGISNISKNHLEGISIAGVVNVAGGYSSGLQFGGIGNIAQESIEGLQFGGLFNASNYNLSGFQATSGVNIAKSDVEGIQAAGILNIAGDDISGLQAAGIGNIAYGSIEGLLASSVFNVARNNASGLLATGGVNIAKDVEGLVFAGVGNFGRDISGLAIGTVNVSGTATGLEIGIINIAKEFEGAPVGVFSLYGNGRKNIDVRFSDGGFTEIGITTGTHRVYNMAILGYNTMLDRDVYRIGVAIGMEKNIQDSYRNWTSNNVFVNQEFSMMHHFEGDYSRRLNWIYSYKYMIGRRFGNNMSVYGGPTFNMQVSRVNNADDYSWYSIWSPTRKGRQYQFWVGFTVGVRLFKQKDLPLIKNEFDNNNWDWDW